jgi:NAD(P)H-dependent flavin oxidoreductase YrpB (nitropropane dioxygenase family)
MRTPICEKLGIELPIFAFSHCRDVVAEVSKAGGFGVLGALAFSPEQLEIELNWIDEHCGGKPYGVDIVMPATYVGKGGGDEASLDNLFALIPEEHKQFVEQHFDEAGIPQLPDDYETRIKAPSLNVDVEGPGQVAVSLQHPLCKMLVNALGPAPKEVVDQAHDHGVLVGALVGAKAHAERQVNIGVDVIVAQGTEAGGHCGEVSTMVLIPEVVDAVGDRAHVLAAGGIPDSRQMAAGLALGAEGVWTGSMWLTVAEADTPPDVLENLLKASSRDTVRSRAMTGKPARQLKTKWTEMWEEEDAPKPLPMPLQGLIFAPAAQRISRAHKQEWHGSPVGQIVGRLNTVRPTKDVIFDMVEQWVEATDRVNQLVQED